MMNQVLNWEKAIYPLLDKNTKIDYVIDFGPGKITTILTKIALQNINKKIEIYSCVGRSGLNQVIKEVSEENKVL